MSLGAIIGYVVNNFNKVRYLYGEADATLAKVTDDSILAHVMAVDGDISNFDDNTDSLEAISIRVNDAEINTTDGGTIVTDTNTGTPKIITITSSGSANTYGSWVTYDASAAADVQICLITIHMLQSSPNEIEAQFQIGTGAGPTEQITIPIYIAADQTLIIPFPIPVKVASGTAISVRATDGNANADAYKIGLAYYSGL